MLEARTYVTKSGRQWYGIWVPQQPREWRKRKIVFPDIAESPQFFLDTTGAVVNGDCYWMAFDDDAPPETLSLVLAVANSSFAVAYYDATCGNRLYAGRRRFITQYVKQFPIPRVSGEELLAIHRLVERLRKAPTERAQLEIELDKRVWNAFGLSIEESWR